MTPMHDDYAERIKKLPVEKQVTMFVEGTRAIQAFAAQKICPIIVTQLAKSPIESAIAATYQRMYLLVEGLAALHESRHFQMAAMATRSLFELVLDLEILVSDPASADKFFDFVDIDKFRKAERLRDFLAAHPAIDPKPHCAALSFANDAARRQRLEQVCVQHWGTTSTGKPRRPKHWSGVDKIEDRAAGAGPQYAEIYFSEYGVQSYYVHPGAMGILNLPREAFERYHAITHNLAQRLFAQATRIVADVYHLFKMQPDLRQELENAPKIGNAVAVAKLLGIPATPSLIRAAP